MNNLEWLMEHDRDALLDIYDCSDIECDECAFDKYDVCGNLDVGGMCRDWFITEHETNGIDGETNGIADGSPLVDGLPEGDALDLMKNKGVRQILIALGIEHDCKKHMTKMLRVLADMVERDYVKREFYVNVGGAFERMKAERDELKRKLEIADRHEFESDQACDECKEHTDEHLAELIADRDAWKTKCETREVAYKQADAERKRYSEQIDELRAERDELDAFAKRLERAAHDKLGVALFGVDYVTEEFMLHVRDTLTAERDEALEIRDKAIGDAAWFMYERDEWKAKAESYRQYADQRECVESGARESCTNLEWLFEHDYETLCDQMGGQPCSCCVVGCESDLGSNEACSNALREWLMAPHMDAQSDTDGTCPDGNETCPNDSEAHSKTESSLSQLFGILSDEKLHETPDFVENPQKTPEQGQESDAFDDCGHIADMSQKSADCVRNDGFMSEVGVRAGGLDANDANATQDSREKLEADVRQYANPSGCTGTLGARWEEKMLEFLDRQAAIEKRRFFDSIAEHQADNLKLQGRIRELEFERERNRKQIDHLTAQCYEMDGLTATAKIRELQRRLDSRGDAEELRERLGKAMDLATQMLDLMDYDGGLA